jgi:outer membrane protein assembly factor BamB
MARITVAFTLVFGLFFGEISATAADWSRFRGPNGSGISGDGSHAPIAWSDSANLKWKRELPGPGSSSAIVVGDRLFVTSWSGYGIDRDSPGEQAKLRRHLTCIDRQTGAIHWDKTVEPYLPEDEFSGRFVEHGYASHTPTSDGETVFVYFGKTGALAFDMEGNRLWQKSVGTESGPRGWGSASSPILYEKLLIVTATAESEALVALDKATGAEVWRQEAAGLNGVWGTPTLVEVDDHRTDLVIAVPGEVWGLDPATGKLRWYCKGVTASSICSSAVACDGVVYAVESGPGGGGGVAVRAGGKGDVTESHTVWAGKQAGRIGSPLIHEGRIYSVARGILSCCDANSGKELYQGRLKSATTSGGAETDSGRRSGGRRGQGGMGGQDYSSPVLADGKIYFASRGGDIHVLEAGDEFKQLSVNRVTRDAEDFSATPAVSQGELFIRSHKHLYCVAQPQE